MARKRMIDPSIWTDDGMAGLTPRQQLLYIGLFSNADDDGRLKGSPVAISLMLPALYRGTPDAEISADLQEVCSTMRQLRQYTVEGRPYLVFQKFRQWQRIDKPSPSILPEPPAESEPTDPPKEPFDERSENDPGTVPPNRKEEKGSQEKGIEDESRANNRANVEDEPPVDDSPSPEPSTDQPFDLLESLCTTLGQDVTALGKSEKGKQLAVAKRLIADGVSATDVERITKWLRSQTWVTGGIDMFFIERMVGKWTLAGKPDVASNVTRLSAPRANDVDAIAAANKASRDRLLARDDYDGQHPTYTPDDDDVIDTDGKACVMTEPTTTQTFEQQLAALNARMNRQANLVSDVNNGYGTIRKQITYLLQQVEDLQARHCMLDAEVKHHTHKLGPRLIGSTGVPDFPFVDTNPEADYIADTRDFDDADVPASTRKCQLGDGECDPKCCPDQPYGQHAADDLRPATMPKRVRVPRPNRPQPAADDGEKADGNWPAVANAMTHAHKQSPKPIDAHGVMAEVHAAKAAVAEAVRQGLVPRIDPEDPKQVRIAADAITYPSVVGSATDVVVKRILTALASHLNGGD